MSKGELASRAAMSRIVRQHICHALHGFVERTKSKQAFVGRIIIGIARVLNERRPTGREIASGAIAEPAAAGLDVETLSDGELGRGSLDVVSVGIGRGELDRIGQLPAVLFELADVARFGGVDIESDFKRLSGSLRQLDEFAELVCFLAEGAASEFDAAIRAAPAGDGRKAALRRTARRGSFVEHDKRRRWSPGDATSGD